MASIPTAPAKPIPATTPAVAPAPASAAKADEAEAQSKSKKKKKKGAEKSDAPVSDLAQAATNPPAAPQLSFREQIQFPPIPADVTVPEPKLPAKAPVKIELDRKWAVCAVRAIHPSHHRRCLQATGRP